MSDAGYLKKVLSEIELAIEGLKDKEEKTREYYKKKINGLVLEKKHILSILKQIDT